MRGKDGKLQEEEKIAERDFKVRELEEKKREGVNIRGEK